MPLNQKQYDLVNFVEQYYLLHGAVPSYDVCSENLSLSQAVYNRSFENKDFRQALLDRGINLRDFDADPSASVVTPIQLLCINTLLDFTDSRSEKKKLADLGITSQQYQSWRRDPAFRSYLLQRSEVLVGDSISDANRALVDGARSGDLGAIKYLHEFTGRYTPKSENNINVQQIMFRMLEVIQRHVADPNVMRAIANDLQSLAPGNSAARPVIDVTPTSEVGAPINVVAAPPKVIEHRQAPTTSGFDL